MDELVLGMLRWGPAHGYDLRKRVRAELGPAWRVASSQLYASLRRLEERGEVVAALEKVPDAPPRRVYTLTAAGENRFAAWLRSGQEGQQRARGSFLVRLYFLSRFAPDQLALYIAQEREVLCRRRARLLRQRTGGDPFLQAVQCHRVSQVEAGLGWLDELAELFGLRKEGA